MLLGCKYKDLVTVQDARSTYFYMTVPTDVLPDEQEELLSIKGNHPILM